METPTRQRWVKEWRIDSCYRTTAGHDLYAVSKRMVDDMQRKDGEVSDSFESEQSEVGLIKVDLSSDFCGMEIPEDVEEQSRPMHEPKRDKMGRPTNVSAR